MKKILRALAGGPLLARAQEQVGQARYKDAMRSLRSLSGVLGCSVASIGMPLRANIITLQASYWLRDADTLKKATTVAVEQSIKHASKSDGAKERYTAAYLYEFCEFSAGRFPDMSADLLFLARKVSQVSFDYILEEVPANLLTEMPMGTRQE